MSRYYFPYNIFKDIGFENLSVPNSKCRCLEGPTVRGVHYFTICPDHKEGPTVMATRNPDESNVPLMDIIEACTLVAKELSDAHKVPYHVVIE